jgi:GNAT superfamily N-acetyltransferase
VAHFCSVLRSSKPKEQRTEDPKHNNTMTPKESTDDAPAITTREATPDDLPVLLGFEQGIVTAERPFDETLKPDPISYYDIGSMIVDPNVQVIVAVDGDLIVGSGYAKEKPSDDYVDPPTHCFLGFMFVRPEYRGRGVNGLVTEALVSWARERGLTEVQLRVYDDNAGALRAYEKAGFKKYMVTMRQSLK